MAQTVQILRTNTNAPPAPLLPGALFVELGTDTKLWTGAAGGNRLLLSSAPADVGVAAGGQAFLPLAGGVMQGPLTLAVQPTADMDAVTKLYVDNAIIAGVGNAAYVRKTGDSMSGKLSIVAPDATGHLQIDGTSTSFRTIMGANLVTLQSSTLAPTGPLLPMTISGSKLVLNNGGGEAFRVESNNVFIANNLDVNGRAALAQVDFGDTQATRTGYFDGTTGDFLARHIDVIKSAPGAASQVNIQQTSVATNSLAQLLLQTPASGRNLSIHVNNSVAEGVFAHGAGLTQATFYFASTARQVRIYDTGNIQTPGTTVYLAGGNPAGPYYYADNTTGAFRLGTGNGAFYVQDVNASVVGGFRSDGWGLSLGARITITNDGQYTKIADGSQRESILLGNSALAVNYYRNTTHAFESPAAARFATINSSGLTVAAAISAGGAISSASLSTGDITASGNITATRVTTSDALISNRADALALYAPSGGVTVGGSITASGGTISCGGEMRLVRDDGVSRNYLQFLNGWGLVLETDTGRMTTVSTSGEVWVMAGSCYANLSWVGGHGAYVDLSDIRLKDADTIVPATVGLPEILNLKPVTFERLPRFEGAPPPRQELGFIAQDVAEAMPHAVVEAELKDGLALGVASEAIVAALVNAVKTLDQRLKTLEGA